MSLVAVYATGVASTLLHWGRELGYRTVLVEPDAGRVTAEHRRHADDVVATVADASVDATTDAVVTDHHAADLADHLAALLRTDARWIGLMGSPRHAPPHVGPLTERGFTGADIARVRRPIGLDIGSRTPAEIALSTLAGLVADRKGRAGGVHRA
ncbi:MAG: XdhC family protein [Actinobacteria bacterium]|nr:XdhC family protein [Actinomycetota bacterium]